VLGGTARVWGRLLFPRAHRFIVETEALRYDLDPLLITAIIREESSFDPGAISSRGALGLMQIMPETGAWIGTRLGVDFAPADLFDPAVNIHFGVWYLGSLLQEYRGDLTRALVAYNAGGNRVRDWIERGAWDGTLADMGRVPYAETRGYVIKIMRSYKIYGFLYR
jgi:soluble lytic murein transglycosylase